MNSFWEKKFDVSSTTALFSRMVQESFKSHTVLCIFQKDLQNVSYAIGAIMLARSMVASYSVGSTNPVICNQSKYFHQRTSVSLLAFSFSLKGLRRTPTCMRLLVSRIVAPRLGPRRMDYGRPTNQETKLHSKYTRLLIT